MGAPLIDGFDDRAGLLVGRFAVGRRRARTPATDVFAGWDHLLDAPVTVEIHRPDARPAHRYRREREVVALASLDHPALLAVHDHGVDPATGRGYVVTTPPDGLTLAERIARGPQPLDRILAIGERLASGLAHLHAAGYVHRRLTPATIRLGRDGEPVLVDLDGVAVLDVESITLEAALALGDAVFLAPEQIAGREVGPTADVHSLARILEACLAAPYPHVGADPTVPAVATPPAVRALLDAMTDPDPERRPGAARVVDEIDGLRHAGHPSAAADTDHADAWPPVAPSAVTTSPLAPGSGDRPVGAPIGTEPPVGTHEATGTDATRPRGRIRPLPASGPPRHGRRRVAITVALVLGLAIELAALGAAVAADPPPSPPAAVTAR